MDTTGKNQSNPNPRVQSFLESLRNRSLTPPTPHSHEIPSQYDVFGEKLRLEQQRKQEFFQTRTKEFNEVYSLKKRQEKARIREILSELQQVAKSMKNLKHELDIAVSQTPIQPGEYQLSVLEHFKLSLREARLHADNASTWLHHFNNRRQKQDYFWAMAKSKGTKFTLSEERQVAISVG